MVSTNGTSVRESVRAERQRRREAARVQAQTERSKNDRLLVEFQPDAVEIEHRSVPGGARWTLYAVVLLICGTVAWAYWAQVDQIVVAQGDLITIDNPIVIQTASTAPITSMLVEFGERVTTGQRLATLDPTFAIADAQQREKSIRGLNARIARLRAEESGSDFAIEGHETEDEWTDEFKVFFENRKRYEAKIKEFDAEQAKLIVQQENNKAEITQNSAKLAIYRELEEKYNKLGQKGSASQIDMLSRKLQRADAETKLLTSENRSRELKSEMEALAKRREAFIAESRAETVKQLVTANQELESEKQELTKAKRLIQLTKIDVPQHDNYDEFVVFEIADRTVGSVMQAGEAMFKLVPVGAPLEAKVEIAGRDIARIREGDEVRVKINSFPFQKHGTLNGVIRKISEGAFEQQNKTAAVQVEPNYRARIELQEPIALENVPEDFRLVPGMSTVAEIKVGRRRVIEYFLYPLLRYLDSSLREP